MKINDFGTRKTPDSSPIRTDFECFTKIDFVGSIGLREHMKVELLTFNRMKCRAIRCISKRQNTFRRLHHED